MNNDGKTLSFLSAVYFEANEVKTKHESLSKIIDAAIFPRYLFSLTDEEEMKEIKALSQQQACQRFINFRDTSLITFTLRIICVSHFVHYQSGSVIYF